MTKMTVPLKRCTGCKRWLPRTEYRRDRSRRDGLCDRCKPCRLAAKRDWIRRMPDASREMYRRRYREGRHVPKRGTRKQLRAHAAVAAAIRKGVLSRPSRCPECGCSDSPIKAHHDDYDRPLDIRWFCSRCHGALHAGHIE